MSRHLPHTPLGRFRTICRTMCLLAALLICPLLAEVCRGDFAPPIAPADSAASAPTDTTSSKPWLLRQLDRHFGRPAAQAEGVAGAFVSGEEPYQRYTGRIIDEIVFTRLRLFSEVPGDNGAVNDSGGLGWLRRVAEATHVNTREHILRQNLVFASGDRINPYVLADNERILRALPFIDDARILVRPDEDHPIFVDVIVITRDRWSLGAAGKIHSAGDYEVEVFERNFLGLGHDLEHEFRLAPDRDPSTSYEGAYNIYNLSGSFVDLRYNHHDTFRERLDRLGLSRALVTPGLRFLGGVTWADQTSLEDGRSINLGGPDYTRSSLAELWIGRAFRVGRDPYGRSGRRQLILAAGIFDRQWMTRPPVSPDIGRVFHDNRRFLGRLTLASNTHFEGSLVRGFGRTEDIPRGYLISLLGGWEKTEFRRRSYSGLELALGEVNPHLGYLNGRLGLGAFRNDGRWQEITLNSQVDYYSNLAETGRWRWRQYLRLGYTRGWHRFPADQLQLGDGFGLRSQPGRHHTGRERLLLNFESLAFTPLRLWGFKVVGFGFADLGLVGPGGGDLFQHKLHAGLGFGVRLKNESLVFDTLELRVGWFPGLDADESSLIWETDSGDRSLPVGFYGARPGIVEFR